MPTDKISAAAENLCQGKMILIYDGDEREGEADLIISARFAKPEIVEILRKEAGGLICVAIEKKDAERFGLPFFTDILEKAGVGISGMICRKTAYGDKPAFSLPINHRNVYTGITDKDRALTITKIDELISKGQGSKEFCDGFYSPGHVFLLIGRGIKNRKGHTELSLEMGRRAGCGAMVLCEMLGKGKALPKKDAMDYAKKNGLVFLEGKEIIESV
jgi:3,4-dihydroxy 2-butanone 4-phosphate synthase